MIPKAYEGALKALYIIGENPLVSDADLNHAKKGIANLDFLIVQDIFMTETARMADVVLPSCCFAEKDGTFTNTERRVQRVRRATAPPGEARADWRIICDLARKMGAEGFNCESSEHVLEKIKETVPFMKSEGVWSLEGGAQKLLPLIEEVDGGETLPSKPRFQYRGADLEKRIEDFRMQLGGGA